jgi:hypothetical protein
MYTDCRRAESAPSTTFLELVRCLRIAVHSLINFNSTFGPSALALQPKRNSWSRDGLLTLRFTRCASTSGLNGACGPSALHVLELKVTRMSQFTRGDSSSLQAPVHSSDFANHLNDECESYSSAAICIISKPGSAWAFLVAQILHL